VRENELRHLGLLGEGLKASFTNLPAFQSWVADRMRDGGLRVEEFTVERGELDHQTAYQQTLRDDPSALQQGPNIVGIRPGAEQGGGLLVYAHADKFPQTFHWARERPEMEEQNGRLIGPGIADDVCGITAMLSAVDTCRRLGFEGRRNLTIASILGKQLSVYGTYGLMSRYGPLPNALYVHPAESEEGLGEIHMSSNGMLEFRLEIEGIPPDTSDPFHTIYDRGALSATDAGVHIARRLHDWAAGASRRHRHQRLEQEAGRSVALLLSRISTENGNAVYQVPLRCVLEGTVCFAPTTGLEAMLGEFKEALDAAVDEHPRLSASRVRLEWGDHMGEAVQSDEEGALVRTAHRVLEEVTGRAPSLGYAYSLSDIRYPIQYWNADAIGIGPRCGSLGEADEWIDREEYLDTIVAVTGILRDMA
jgi:acetylornithine deacetylase